MSKFHRVPEISARTLRVWAEISFLGACALIVLWTKVFFILLREILYDGDFPTLWVVAVVSLTGLWTFQSLYRKALLP